MNYIEQINDYLRYYIPKTFGRGIRGFDMDSGKKAVDAYTFQMYIGSRIVSLRVNGVADSVLVGLWSAACQQIIVSAHKNIEVAKVFCSKEKYSFSLELHLIWDEVFHRELNNNNAKSRKDLDEKILLNKTYTQLLIYISNAIKNCELFPVNDQTRNDLELLKIECQNHLQDKYNSAKPTIELLTEDELFNMCQSKNSYGEYLEYYPDGVYSKKAKRKYYMKENITTAIIIVFVVILFGFLFYLFFVRGDWQNSLYFMAAGVLLGIILAIRKKVFGF